MKAPQTVAASRSATYRMHESHGISTSGARSSDIPDWLQLVEEGLSEDAPNPENVGVSEKGGSHSPCTCLAERPKGSNKSASMHDVFAHFPKDPNCEVCKLTKIVRAQCRRQPDERIDHASGAKKFADIVSADRKILNEDSESRLHHRHAVVVRDLFADWIQAYPIQSKTAHDTKKSLQRFLPLVPETGTVYTENDLEFVKPCDELTWSHDTSTPYRPETNGSIERAVDRVKEGTSALMLLSGLSEGWWRKAKECFCYPRNMQDKLADAMSPSEKRFDAPFDEPIILFGEHIKYHPISQKDTRRLHQFGIEVLPDVFIGYILHAGGGLTEDLLIADWDELEKNVAPEVHVKRFKSAELIRISCRWVLHTRRARSTSCLAIRTKANRDHRCEERTTHSVCGRRQLHA